MENLENILKHYGVEGKIVGTFDGPMVNLTEFLPQPGTKVKNITSSLDDISRELGTVSLRVEPIAENGTIGFEVPAEQMKMIDFSSLLSSSEFVSAKGDLPIILGVDIKGVPIIADLAKMPHLLVAGTTGSGKSVGLNTFILSLIAKHKPADLKLVLIDPKRIEFSQYNNIRYLLAPVVTENKDAAAMLNYLAEEMERRYGLFEESLVKNISEYNENSGHLPHIVCVIDEFADLMANDKKTSALVQRLAQKARASGIHLILATQRPSVDVVTGVLKANFPTRLSYKTASSADSRTILDVSGAEKLIGRGDALFLAADGTLKRVHGAYASDDMIDTMLKPYRGEVKPIKFPETENVKNNDSTSQQGKSFFRRMWDFWISLRQKDKKVIVNGVMYLFSLFVTSKNKKRR